MKDHLTVWSCNYKEEGEKIFSSKQLFMRLIKYSNTKCLLNEFCVTSI